MLLEYVHALCVSLSGAGFNVARPAGYAAEAGDYETPQAASAARQARPGGCGQSRSRAVLDGEAHDGGVVVAHKDREELREREVERV